MQMLVYRFVAIFWHTIKISPFFVFLYLSYFIRWFKNLTNCLTLQTVKSFLEETMVAIPDSVLDSSFAKSPPGHGDLFANIDNLLPPPYRTRDEDSVYVH